ncbi:MAG TPA: hypothetical protein VF220_03750 [Nitrososphaeraceae archaeon]
MTKRDPPPATRNTKGSRLMGYLIDKYYANPDKYDKFNDPRDSPENRAWKRSSLMMHEIETMPDAKFNSIVEDRLMKN